MTTVFQRLLKYPHAAVFDKAPGAELALRIQHPDGAVWRVADDQLVVTAGAAEFSYRLPDFTVAGLAARLQLDGFSVASLSPEFSGRSALVLAEGQGDQGESNGDHVHAFTSILWALLGAYGGELRAAEYQVLQALRQMVITQAEGEWLDLWGTLYGVARLGGESDADYATRIPHEAFRIRVNARAIELAIRDALGVDVRIEEPWTQVFTLDQSLLSGPDRLRDGETIGHHLIKPVSRQNVDWDAVLAVIERNRAAGIKVLRAGSTRVSHVDAGGIYPVHYALRSRNPDHLRYEDRALLDYMAIEDLSILNYSSRRRRNLRHISHSEVPSLSWAEVPWLPVAWTAPSYIVRSVHRRSYRVHYMSADYSSRYRDAGDTWAAPEATWSDLPRQLRAGHSQTTDAPNFVDAVLALDPIMYHRMNETSGTSFADASGNGHAGTLRGSVTLGQPPLIGGNTACITQTSGGGMDAPDPFPGVTYAGPWSAMVVFSTPTAPPAVVNGMFLGRGVTDWSVMCVLRPDGGFDTNVVVAAANNTSNSSSGAYTPGTVCIFIVTYEPGVGHKTYVNGAHIASANFGSLGLRFGTPGAQVAGTTGYTDMSGFSFSDHAWFASTLTPEQIADLQDLRNAS